MDQTLVKYESLMAAAQVPRQYWNVALDKRIKPISFPYEKNGVRKSLKTERQIEWVEDLLKNNPKTNPRMVLSSFPTDHTAMIVASTMVSNRIKANARSRPLVVNAAILQDMKLPACDFCVLHNIYTHSQPYRLQLVRDFITRVDYCPIVVVVGGLNPIEWSQELNLNINRAAYYKEIKVV